MTSHTPGPWRAKFAGNNGHGYPTYDIVPADLSPPVCRVRGKGARINAALIVKAPELLVALQDAIEDIEELYSQCSLNLRDPSEFVRRLDRYRAAVIAAKRETQ